MIYIRKTEHIFNKKEAEKFLKGCVVIEKKSLKKIEKLAKKHGFFDELKSLNIQIHNLESVDE